MQKNNQQVELSETQAKKVAAGVSEISTDLLQQYGANGFEEGTKDVDVRY